MAITVAEFWDYVDRRGPDECWPWLGKCTKAGYGYVIFKVGEKLKKTVPAHRAALILSGVELAPPKRMACHVPRCTLRSCCNPNHLYAGTAQENFLDGVRAGTIKPFRKGVAPQGAGRPKGTTAIPKPDVDRMRRMWRGQRNRVGLRKRWAEEFGVSDETVAAALHGTGRYSQYPGGIKERLTRRQPPDRPS